jgi:hypothetical protein
MSIIAEVVVNGYNVNIYNSDTNETFINRVSSLLKTHPNFIEEINIDDLKTGDQITIGNLRQEIKDYEYSNNPDDNVIFIKELQEKYNKNDILTILKLFLSLHNHFKHDIDDYFIMTELDPLEKALKDDDIIINLQRFFQEGKKDFVDEIKRRINYSNREAEELQELNKQLVQIKSIIKDVNKLNIKKDISDLKIITNLKEENLSLSSIFSNIICTDNCPFLSYNDIFKVNNNFNMDIPEDWSISSSNFMILKINVDSDKYTNCNIYYNDKGSLVLLININYYQYTNLSSGTSSEENIRENIKEKIKECFKNITNFTFIEEHEVDISENVIIPDQTFDTYVLSDIVMNNNILSRFLAVNESVQTTKKKSGLYVHYFLKNFNGTCNITTLEDHSSYPIKTVVRLRIKKAKNQDVANEFINLVGKLFSVYNSDEQKIISFYKKYITNFPKEKEKELIEDLKQPPLQKLVPDLFVKGYAHKCQYPPVIIPEDKIDEYDKDNIMKYPIKGEGNSYYYYCNDEKKKGFKYIGLRVNHLQNKDKYKYIPCCFESDQTKRKGPYMEYFQGEVIEKGPQQNIIVTNKFVRKGEFGILPANINKLLTSINGSYNYLRKGVMETPLSFLDCVLEATEKYKGKKKTERESFLQNQFEDLVNFKNIGLASQENPGKTEEQIKDYIEEQTKSYMIPNKTVRLCEQIYNCKIIVFSRGKNDKDAIISLPYHELVYLYEKFDNKKIVLIYEHYGKEFNLRYPRCELIVRYESLDEGVYDNFSGSFSKSIYNFYNSLMNQYYYTVFNKKLNTINGYDLSQLTHLNPSHQIIDNYGKARGIVINNITLLSDPFPPINANILTYNPSTYKVNNLTEVMDFINENNILIESQVVINETITEINIKISGINFTTKVNRKDADISEVKTDIIEKYPSINKDINNVVYLKRLAFIISEYFSYYFSCYLNENNKTLSLESIREFIKRKVKVKNLDKQYVISNTPIISKDILKQYNFISEDKFIVENMETLKRLIYTLRVKMSNNMNNLINYYKSKQVHNFHEDIGTLSKNQDNIVVNKISDLQKINNKVYERLQTESEQFFMHNSLINDNNPVLLKKASDKEEAFLISSNWNKYNKVTTYEDENPSQNNILYLYKSLLDIKVNKDIKDDQDKIAYALKYRKDKEDNYLALINM